MHYTYTGGRVPQTYVSWKGTSTNMAVPTFSRPLLPTETGQNGPSFKARPIKHWRKQLSPNNVSSGRRAGVGIPTDLPGGEVYLGRDATNCDACGESTTYLKSILFSETRNNFQQGVTTSNDDTPSYQVCIACNPENNVIKSARTVIGQKYYTDRKAYLESRCLTYTQRLSGARVPGIEYITEDGKIIPPSDSATGSQIRNTLNCSKECATESSIPTIYKPNNSQYATQGAVSSSSRIVRLKLNTINKNGSSFETAFGAQAANAGKYHGTSEAPYFIKSKTNVCNRSIYHRNGNHTMCF